MERIATFKKYVFAHNGFGQQLDYNEMFTLFADFDFGLIGVSPEYAGRGNNGILRIFKVIAPNGAYTLFHHQYDDGRTLSHIKKN